MEQMTEAIAVRFIELLNETVFPSEKSQIIQWLDDDAEMKLSDLNDQGWIEGEETMCNAFEDATGSEFMQNSEGHNRLWEDAWALVKAWRFGVPDAPTQADIEMAIELLKKAGYIVFQLPTDELIDSFFEPHFQYATPLFEGEHESVRIDMQDVDTMQANYESWIVNAIENVLDNREPDEEEED